MYTLTLYSNIHLPVYQPFRKEILRMCLVHETPHRGYLIQVLGQTPPSVYAHNGPNLLKVLQAEVAAGVYTDATLWHPVATELLTFAAEHMADIQKVVAEQYDRGEWKYPVCDIIEGIGALLKLPRPEGFTAAAQQAHFQSLTDRSPGGSHSWKYAELSVLLGWVMHYRNHLPLTITLLESIPAAQYALANKKLQASFRAEQARLKNRMRDLRNRANQWKYKGLARVDNALIEDLHHLLHLGYSLSQCREIILNANPQQAPRQMWGSAWPYWHADLASLPEGILQPDQRHRVNTYRKMPKRSKVLAHTFSTMLKSLETGIPLLRHLFPESTITLDQTGATWEQLRRWANETHSLFQRLSNFSDFHKKEKMETEIARMKALLERTDPAPAESLPLAA